MAGRDILTALLVGGPDDPLKPGILEIEVAVRDNHLGQAFIEFKVELATFRAGMVGAAHFAPSSGVSFYLKRRRSVSDVLTKLRGSP